jgi:hypothetical protein
LGKATAGWSFRDVAAVAVDRRDRVYTNRGEHPMIVFDRDGNFIKSWGEGPLSAPTASTLPDDTLYCTDDGDHTVRKWFDGRVLLTIGIPTVRPAT